MKTEYDTRNKNGGDSTYMAKCIKHETVTILSSMEATRFKLTEDSHKMYVWWNSIKWQL